MFIFLFSILIITCVVAWLLFASQTFDPLEAISLLRQCLYSIYDQFALLVLELVARKVKVLNLIILSESFTENLERA